MTIDSLARLLPSSVRVRAVAYAEERVGAWRGWLSEEELACLASFGAETRQQEFLVGRAAARRLLAERLDCSPAEVPLRRAADDAIDVEVPDWHVSIAHSGLHAVAACAQHRVGVDLERIQPRDPAIARFLFAPEERGIVEALPYDANASLILCWALKEATLKARRTGFRTSPKDLTLDVQPAAGRATARIENGERWRLVFARLDGFWSAVGLPES
jgi:4'-phosphopantetheinyl transferase